MAPRKPRKRKAQTAPAKIDDRSVMSWDNLTSLRSGFGSTLAGPVITEHTSLQITAVWAAVKLLSNAIAGMSFKAYENLPSGGKKPALDHPVFDLVHDTPNGEISSYKFKQSLMVHTLTRGNGYCEIVRQGAKPVALHLLDPKVVEPKRDSSDRLYYHLTDTGRNLDPMSVIHIAEMGWDGVRGMAPIVYAAEAFGLAKASEQFSSSMLGNSAVPQGILQYPGTLDEVALGRLRDNWNARHQGSDRAGNVGLLQGGVTWIQTQFSPEDAQLILTRSFSIAEIARVYNVPQHMIGLLDHATFSNIEQQELSFYSLSLLPWLEMIEQEFNLKLFTPAERKVYFVEHNFNSFLRADIAARSAYYQQMNGIGVLSTNEIRGFENLNPIDGGDVHAFPLNMTTLEAMAEEDTEEEATEVPTQDDTPPVATEVPSVTDAPVANSAMNGAQVTSLVEIVTAVSTGSMPSATGKALIAASFPTLTTAQIDAIIDPIQPKDELAPAPPVPPPGEAPPGDEAPPPGGDPPPEDSVRTLVADTLGRLVRRECTALRRAANRPEALHAWAEGYYPAHQDFLAKSLSPVLGALGVRSDPTEVAARITQESRGRLAELYTTIPPDEIGDAVARLLTDWETHRANHILNDLEAHEKH